MKLVLSFVGIVLMLGAVFLFKDEGVEKVNDDYLRIYVTANSNSDKDEQIKYAVKDDVVDFLIPLLAEVKTKEEAEEVILQNMQKINEVVKSSLQKNDVSYGASVSIDAEQVPLRVYDDLVLEEGVYQCLKIELGAAKGGNWWCVVFPAVCFVSSKNYDNLVYISKIWEIINNVT